jgi:hypothetical protein
MNIIEIMNIKVLTNIACNSSIVYKYISKLDSVLIIYINRKVINILNEKNRCL